MICQIVQLCHYSLQWLEIVCRQFPQSIIFHYMDDVLLADSDKDTLEKMFKGTQRILPCWGLQIAPKKYRVHSINYLGYKISQQKKSNHKRYRSVKISCKILMIFKN